MSIFLPQNRLLSYNVYREILMKGKFDGFDESV